MDVRSMFLLLLVATVGLVRSTPIDALVDTTGVLRKLLEEEKLCEEQISNFRPEKERTLKSPTCSNGALLTECVCTSDNNKVVVTDVKEKVNKGLCKCTFTNEGKNKKNDVKIKACSVCKTAVDECKHNRDCTEFERPICNREAVPRICVRCTKDSHCYAGETCIDNVCTI